VSDRTDSLIEYPTDFPIKIMGKSVPDFEQTIIAVVLQHAPDFDPATVEIRPSRAGNYVSVTCTIRATSREQLDDLYRALSGHPMVKVVL
jgi:putative lipoic acid-binding regulatory protein